MKLITERTQVREVAKRWANSYPENGPYGRDPQKQAITKALAALDVETATAADVAAIIGNDSWCCPQKCHECGAVVDVAVQVGEEPDYESNTATLCFACVENALALMGPNVGGEARLAAHQPSQTTTATPQGVASTDQLGGRVRSEKD